MVYLLSSPLPPAKAVDPSRRNCWDRRPPSHVGQHSLGFGVPGRAFFPPGYIPEVLKEMDPHRFFPLQKPHRLPRVLCLSSPSGDDTLLQALFSPPPNCQSLARGPRVIFFFHESLPDQIGGESRPFRGLRILPSPLPPRNSLNKSFDSAILPFSADQLLTLSALLISVG